MFVELKDRDDSDVQHLVRLSDIRRMSIFPSMDDKEFSEIHLFDESVLYVEGGQTLKSLLVASDNYAELGE